MSNIERTLTDKNAVASKQGVVLGDNKGGNIANDSLPIDGNGRLRGNLTSDRANIPTNHADLSAVRFDFNRPTFSDRYHKR
jgi:hypothetical protein